VFVNQNSVSLLLIKLKSYPPQIGLAQGKRGIISPLPGRYIHAGFKKKSIKYYFVLKLVFQILELKKNKNETYKICYILLHVLLL